jgi:hypothetical protein
MREIDPDILAVLKAIAASGEVVRVAKVNAKHERQALDRMETQLELLSDELERVIPRSHPIFNTVLMGAAIHKVSRTQEEPEFRSFLEFPNDL